MILKTPSTFEVRLGAPPVHTFAEDTDTSSFGTKCPREIVIAAS
jgi:hypothetical protein